MAATARDVTRNLHADRLVPGQVQEPNRPADPDFGISPIVEFSFRELYLANDTIALVAEHGLQKTDFR